MSIYKSIMNMEVKSVQYKNQAYSPLKEVKRKTKWKKEYLTIFVIRNILYLY